METRLSPEHAGRFAAVALGHALADSLTGDPATLLEHALDERLAADGPDGRQEPGRQAVVVGREQVLGGIGHVVLVARTAHAVLDGAAIDQARCLERMELLEGITHPKPLEELLDQSFTTYAASQPWIGDFALSPKSVVRDMYERAMSFSELISFYKLMRSEGLVPPA